MSLPYSPSITIFNGNGVATQFPFSFKVWEVSQLVVSVVSPEGIVEQMPFTASLTDSGGTVTFLMNNAPLPTGWRLSVMRDMPFDQEVDLITGTRFDPQVIEDALDRATAERQQLREAVGRAIVVPPGNENPPELLAQEIFDARDGALTSAAHAAMSEANAEAAAVEAVQARDASLAIVDSASSAGLAALEGLRDASLNDIGALRDASQAGISSLRDASLTQISSLGASQVTDISQKADIKLAELTALSVNMETVGNSTMAAVVAEGDTQGQRLRGESSTAVTQVILQGDAQAQRVVDTATPLVNEARTEADRSASEADRAELAAGKAVDMTGVGLASKTNFGMAKVGSGIDVVDGVLSVKFPRVVSTPTLNFVAQVGIGYSYVLSMSASTGAAESSIEYFRVFVDAEAEIRIPASNGTATHTITVVGLDGSVGNIVASAVDTYANPSDDKTITFTKHTVVKQAPRILQPVNGDTNIALRPVLTLQALQVTGLPATPAATQVLVATDEAFANLVHDSGEVGYTTSYTVPVELPHRTTLYMKARHKADFYGWSDYGPVTVASSIEKKVLPLTVISPPNASMGQSVTPTLVLSAMQSTGIVDSPVATHAQIATDSAFSQVVFNTGESGAYGTNIAVAAAHMLQPTSTYYVRARHKGLALGWSAWSLASSFSTLDAYTHRPSVSCGFGEISNSIYPTLTVSALVNTGPADVGANTHLQISTDESFGNIVFNTTENNAYSTAVSSGTALAQGARYYARARHRGQLWGWSAWSTVKSFVVISMDVSTPVITSPAQGERSTTLRPAFGLSAFAATNSKGKAAGSAVYSPRSMNLQIATDAAFGNLVVNYTGAVHTAYSPTVDLPENTTLYCRLRHTGFWTAPAGKPELVKSSAWSATRAFITVDAFINTPAITAPAAGSTTNTFRPVVNISAFRWTGVADTVANTRLQVSRNAGFTNLLLDTGDAGAYITTYTPPADWPMGAQLWVRARHRGARWGWSAWSTVVTFTILAGYISKPSIIYPTAPLVMSDNPAIFGSAFSSVGGDKFKSATLTLRKGSDSPIVRSGSYINFNILDIPAGTYQATLNYQGNFLPPSGEGPVTTIKKVQYRHMIRDTVNNTIVDGITFEEIAPAFDKIGPTGTQDIGYAQSGPFEVFGHYLYTARNSTPGGDPRHEASLLSLDFKTKIDFYWPYGSYADLVPCRGKCVTTGVEFNSIDDVISGVKRPVTLPVLSNLTSTGCAVLSNGGIIGVYNRDLIAVTTDFVNFTTTPVPGVRGVFSHPTLPNLLFASIYTSIQDAFVLAYSFDNFKTYAETLFRSNNGIHSDHIAYVNGTFVCGGHDRIMSWKWGDAQPTYNPVGGWYNNMCIGADGLLYANFNFTNTENRFQYAKSANGIHWEPIIVGNQPRRYVPWNARYYAKVL